MTIYLKAIAMTTLNNRPNWLSWATKSTISTEDYDNISIRRTSVESSNILTMGYSGKYEILEIEFKSGSVYRYFEVSRYFYDNMKNASSVGKYFHQKVRNQFRFEKVSD